MASPAVRKIRANMKLPPCRMCGSRTTNRTVTAHGYDCDNRGKCHDRRLSKLHDMQTMLYLLVGMSVRKAEGYILQQGFTSRRTFTDGRSHIVTRDYRRDRINLCAVAGTVTRAYVG